MALDSEQIYHKINAVMATIDNCIEELKICKNDTNSKDNTIVISAAIDRMEIANSRLDVTIYN